MRHLYILLVFVTGLFFTASAQTGTCPGQVKIRVIIQPDTKPQETSWDLVTAAGDTLKKGLANSDSVCVSDTVCVKFTIHDAGANGLCCTFGIGNYAVYYGDLKVRSNYKFKSSESVNMGCKSCQPQPNEKQIKVYINPDRFPEEISWDLVNGNGDTLAKGKTAGDTICVSSQNCLRFSMHDSYGDGICCNQGLGDYAVYSNDSLVFSGGDYTFTDSKSMCVKGYDCSSAVEATLDTFTTFYDDNWYKFIPDTNGIFTVSTCNLGNTCQTKIWVYDYCTGLSPSEGNAGTLAYSNDGCGLQAKLDVVLNKNQPYYIRIGDELNACNPDSIRWALSYKGPIIGCMDPASCTYNPLATVADTNLCLYSPDTNCPDQPDLVVNSTLLRTSFKYDSLTNNDACYIQEGCLKGYGKRYIVRFGTQIENVGNADYYIGKPPANPNIPSNQWIWDPCHGHWHYKGYAEYILFDKNSNPIPAGFKAGFCVMDLNCSFGGGTPKYNCSNQGITAHCGDIYSSSLKCQWIDITDVDTGRYTMVAKVNWDNSPDLMGRIESNTFNNWGQICIKISKSASGLRKVTLLPDCNPFVDCDGQVFGSAVRDCDGVCHGTKVHGDINNDNVRNEIDLVQYISGTMDGSLASTTCRDLNGDGQVNIVDIQMLAKCLDDTPPNVPPAPSCKFNPLISNPDHTVRIGIDTVNMAEGYVDLTLMNPQDAVSAFQFTVSGLSVDSVRFLTLGDSGLVTLRHTSNGKILGSLIRNQLLKSTQEFSFLRAYFDSTNGNEVCISSISGVLNPEMQIVGTAVGPCKQIGSVTSIVQKGRRSTLRLVPNPFSNQTRLYFTNPSQESLTLVIFDTQGKKVREVKGIQGTDYLISAQGLQPGMYFFQLKGQEIRNGKLWVEK